MTKKSLIKKNLKRHLFTLIKFKIKIKIDRTKYTITLKLFKEFQNDYDKNLLLRSIFFVAHFGILKNEKASKT